MIVERTLRRPTASGLGERLREERPLVAFVGVMAALMVLHRALPEASAAQDMAFLAGSAAAVVGLVAGILFYRPAPATAWWLLAAGQLGTFIGDAVWTLAALNGETGLGSMADLIYLTAYPMRTLGLYLMVRPRYERRVRDGLLDIAIISVAMTTGAWLFVIEPLLLSAGSDPAVQAVAIAYPVLDLLVASVAVAYLLAPGPRTTSFVLLLVGTLAMLATNTAYTIQQVSGTYAFGGMLDLGWLLAYGLFAAAALHSSVTVPVAASRHHSPDAFRKVMLAGALLVGPVLLLLSPPDDDADLIVVAATTAALGMLVLARLLRVTGRLDEDLLQRRALEARLLHQASHDPLTGLPNRRLFFERLSAASTMVGREGAVALMFVDVDDLKSVNDSLGHDAGDRLLVAIADRLRANLRPGDLAARLGGDEFALLVEGVADQAAAEELADRLEVAIREPVPFGTTTVAARASIGVAVQDDVVEGAEDLLRAADLAMYRAKTLGKGRRVSFIPAMHAQAMQRLELRRDLTHAIGGDQIVLEYQPVVDLRTGRIGRLEALVRWNHPRHGRLAPEAFVGLAEEAGLIRDLGEAVLGQACREIVRLDRGRRGEEPLGLSVNIAVGQLTDTAFAEGVLRTLEQTGLDPARLWLEVSDSDLDRYHAVASAGLTRLREHGLRLAIDDFGGANSSVGLLRSIDADELKLDRGLVGDVDRAGASSADLVLARAVIEIGAALGVEVVAVGVERPSQLDVLRRLGCHAAQGYLFSEPIPPARLPGLLDGWPLSDRAHATWAARRATDLPVGPVPPVADGSGALQPVLRPALRAPLAGPETSSGVAS